jgi:hypothetical protein
VEGYRSERGCFANDDDDVDDDDDDDDDNECVFFLSNIAIPHFFFASISLLLVSET